VVGPVQSKVYYQFAGVREMKRRKPPYPTIARPNVAG
jgi:hypothetical protein